MQNNSPGGLTYINSQMTSMSNVELCDSLYVVDTVFVCSIWVRSMNIWALASFNGSLNSCIGRGVAWDYSGHKHMAANGYPTCTGVVERE